MLQVKVSSPFRKGFLNYSGNISTLKVKVLGKNVNFSAREKVESFWGHLFADSRQNLYFSKTHDFLFQ